LADIAVEVLYDVAMNCSIESGDLFDSVLHFPEYFIIGRIYRAGKKMND